MAQILASSTPCRVDLLTPLRTLKLNDYVSLID
jgi:hypothetical protein